MKTNNKIIIFVLSMIGIGALLSSCATKPKKAKVIDNFEVEKYLGTWYEIARFDFRFERNLNNVSAQYSLKSNGDVNVLNSGYDYEKNKWKKAVGKAKLRGSKNIAALKVSFLGPFYSGYNVVALDDNYQYALIVGKNLDYLWILSRTKDIPESVKTNYLEIAKAIGFDLSRLIWVKHDRTDNPYLN